MEQAENGNRRAIAPHERIERLCRDEDYGCKLVALGHLGNGDRVWHELRIGLDAQSLENDRARVGGSRAVSVEINRLAGQILETS